jgi:hypothetical protein
MGSPSSFLKFLRLSALYYRRGSGQAARVFERACHLLRCSHSQKRIAVDSLLETLERLTHS